MGSWAVEQRRLLGDYHHEIDLAAATRDSPRASGSARGGVARATPISFTWPRATDGES